MNKKLPISCIGIFRELLKTFPLQMVFWFLIPIILGLSTLPLFIFRKNLIYNIINITSNNFNYLDIGTLKILCIIFIITIFQHALLEVSNYYNYYVTHISNMYFRNLIWEKSFAIPIYLFEDTNVQDLFNRAKTYLGESFIDFIKYFSEVLRLTITIISLIAFMGFINLKLIIYLLFITLISIVLKTVIEVKVKNFDKGNTIYGRKSYYLSNILTESTFLKEGKIFNYKDYISKKWIYNSKKYLENRGSIRRKEIFIGLLIGLLNIFLIFTTINTIIYESKKENIIPDITVALWVLILLQNYTYSIVVNMQVLISSSLNLNDIIDVLRLEEETERQYSLKDIKSIELKNVFFKYPNTNDYVLKNINLSLKTTDKLVIVGQNGSGKSTLLKIILGFYDDYEGEIFINGTPLSKISKKSIYDNSSVVLQNITKFPIDIKEYIHLGTKKLFSSIDIENYFIDTNIDNFIKKLDSKHNTFLGNFQNNNSNISGGQWNQLVFMREILKKKDFLILDEVTSNLDPLTEKNIYNYLFNNSLKNNITLAVSHRMGWAKDATKIIVMKDGEIVEEGCHRELLNRKFEYYNLFKTQSSWYK